MKQNDLMIDLETLSTNKNAVILSIGACAFGPEEVTGQLYTSVDLSSFEDYEDSCFHMSASTIAWWMKQSHDARTAFDNGESLHIEQALETLRNFIETMCTPDVRVWGNGSDFDNVILQNAYDVCGLELPWKFWNNRCYRTVKGMCPEVKIEREGTNHNALDDAESQANHLITLNEFHLEIFQ